MSIRVRGAFVLKSPDSVKDAPSIPSTMALTTFGFLRKSATMAVKIRSDLSDIAKRVQTEFADSSSPLLTRAQIEAAIAKHAESPEDARLFSDGEYRALLRLRSQAFKSPDKMLKLAP
jgi:hypothetical protein